MQRSGASLQCLLTAHALSPLSFLLSISSQLLQDRITFTGSSSAMAQRPGMYREGQFTPFPIQPAQEF